ncbi:hypothetical protein ACEXQE_14400 [Herbiconiux sp. P17]|uniref:hypothetical protein n=1 Tax=Herbiconiux wuyangfengii TaxID=3342794 RepID=UPI0035B713D7
MTSGTGMILTDPLHDEFSRWPLAYPSTGSIERGEAIAIPAAVDASFAAGTHRDAGRAAEN